jgi:lipoprotein signal peptidase
LLTAGIVFTVDAATKAWARRLPAEGVQRGGFTLRLQYNAGAAFGWGNHHSALFGLVTVAFICYCAVVTWRKIRTHTPAGLTPMALMCGGAAGNLLDRLSGGGHGPLSGSVADWLHVTGYPFAFNLADVAVRVGAAGLTIGLWRASTPSAAPDLADAEDPDRYDVEPEPFCGSSTSA